MLSIKQFRRKNNMTQTDLAVEIGVSLRTIQLYERRNANIPMKNLTKMAEVFGMSITEMYMNEANETDPKYGNRKPFAHMGNPCYVMGYGKTLLMAPIILLEEQGVFIQALGTSTIKEMTHGGFVLEALGEGHHVAFEVSGDAMMNGTIDAIPNKSLVLGTEVAIKTFLKKSETYIGNPMVLVYGNRIICRQLDEVDAINGMLRCKNLNDSPEYQDFEIPISEVVALYRVVKKQY
ncbi:MAG: XRE family transcriptional regulator [Bacteroidota bacterium]